MRKTLATIVAAAAVLLGAGCSGAGSSGTRNGAPQPAGEPIVLGLTNQEGLAGGSWPEFRQAAEAAVKYVNTDLGGVYGRPLKLVTCVTNGTPEGSAKCANTILEQKPLVVLGGADIGTEGSMSIYTRAKMPYLGGAPLGFPEMSAPNSVQWAGYAFSGIPAMAAHAADQLHAKRVVIVHPQLPGTSDFIAALAKPVLGGRGITDVRLLGSDIRQPDKTALVTAAAQTKPDAIIVIDAGAGCMSFLQAHAALAPTTNLLITGNCVEGGILAAAGPTAEGVYTTDEYVYQTEPDNADTKIFTKALRDYAPADMRVTAFAATGFAGVMNVYQTLKNLPAGRLDAATILATLKSAKDSPNFLSHPFTCDGRFKPAPAICNGAVRVLQVKSGKLVAVTDWLEAGGAPSR
jgi:branched-chain amino acid transport system substrate-binding protein